MQVLLILAGRSTRFWPLTEKTLFPIAGTTLLDTQIERLKKAGLTDITLVVGKHNQDEVRMKFPKMKRVEQKDLDLGMQGALLSGLSHVKKSEPVLVVSANDIIESDAYKDLKIRAKGMCSGGLILARKVKHYFPGGYLTVRKGRIESIVEKPKSGSEPSDLVNLVAHVHLDVSALLEALKEQKSAKDDAYERALAVLFKRHMYKAVPYTGYWQAVKYPWHLLDLLAHLLPSTGKPVIHKTASIHATAVIEGPVIIGPGVRVLAHASVIGPCMLGEGVIVGNNAMIRGSSVGDTSVIGYNTEVTRSIVGRNVWTHSSYLGDSVIGDNVSFGAGSVTGNLRLDEAEISSVIKGELVATGRNKLGLVMGSGCRIGIHTSFAPGVKVGAGTFINSTAFITNDVSEHSYVTMKNGQVDARPNRTVKVTDRSQFRKAL